MNSVLTRGREGVQNLENLANIICASPLASLPLSIEEGKRLPSAPPSPLSHSLSSHILATKWPHPFIVLYLFPHSPPPPSSSRRASRKPARLVVGFDTAQNAPTPIQKQSDEMVALGDKMNLTVRLGKLFYGSSIGVPALLPCSQLPRQARGILRKLCT